MICLWTREADVKVQLELELKVVTLLSEARKLEDKLVEEKKQLTKQQKEDSLDATMQERLDKISGILDLLKAKSGAYPTPMLTNQIGYLYGMISNADQLPGKDAYERFDEVNKQFEDIKKIL